VPRPPDHPAPDPSADRRNPHWLFAVALGFAGVAVGYAVHVRDGEYTPEALKWVSVALALCVTGVALPRVPDPRQYGNRLVVAALAIAASFQFYQLLRSPPGGWNWWSDDVRRVSSAGLRFFYGGVAAAFLLTLGLLRDDRRVRRACLPLLLGVHFALGVWMIRASPAPHIDVFEFQQEGAAALLRGSNPYTATFTDIYHGTPQEKDREVYGKGLSEQGKLKFGFPYPPVSLYLAALGYAVAGDHRYAQLVAMTLAGAFVACCRPGRLAALAAALVLFTPRGFFVLGRGWTEPFVVLMVAATVFCACRRSRWGLPVALGLLFAVKQYMIFAAPLALLLAPRPWTFRSVLGLLLPAGVVAAAASAPLALWDWHAFYHSAFTVQKVAPFREDALSYLVWIYHQHGTKLPVGVAFAALGAAMALSLWRCPRDASGFAAALAVSYLAFIAFNKQAFANYYYFVIGALCCAVAAVPVGEGPRVLAQDAEADTAPPAGRPNAASSE
jgi:hypothetical protein